MSEEIVIKKRDPEDRFYVSNKDLFAAYMDWYAAIDEANKNGKEEPPIPKYIAECMVKICTRLGYKSNFINYSYRSEMVGDAIENVVRTAKKFNPEKSSNPFSFITTIAFNAFLRRIATEKKQTYIKGKLIEEMPIEDIMNVSEHDTENFSQHQQLLEFLRDNSYIAGTEMPKRKKKEKKVEVEEDIEKLVNDIPIADDLD